VENLANIAEHKVIYIEEKRSVIHFNIFFYLK